MTDVMLTPTGPTALGEVHLNALSLRRSTAFDLIQGSQTNDEVREELERALTPEVRSMIQPVLRDLRGAMALPRTKSEAARVAIALNDFLDVVATSMSPDTRASYVRAALKTLNTYPLMMVLPLLEEAPRRLRFPGEILPWVETEIAKERARMRQVLDVVERMAEAAA